MSKEPQRTCPVCEYTHPCCNDESKTYTDGEAGEFYVFGLETEGAKVLGCPKCRLAFICNY